MDRRDFFKTSALTGAALISGTLSSSVGQSAYAAKGKTKSRSRAGEAPVAAEADVVVIGGGPAGFGAAVRAARAGAKTILIDRYDVPGGVHTVGLQGAYNAGVGGIHTELMQRLSKEGHIYTATEKTLPDLAGNPLSHYEWYLKPGSAFSRSTFNPDSGGTVMLTMLREAGVKALYNTTFVDVKMKKPPKGEMSIESVIVKNVAGTQAVKGKVFIDASGMAEVVARAGAPFVPGGGGQPATVSWDGKNRPVPGGLLWIMTGIDFDKVVHYQKSQNDPTLAKLISTALAANDIPPDLFRPRLGGTNVYANLYIGHPTLDLSPIQGAGTFILWENVPYEWSLHLDENPDDMLRAQIAMREFVNAEARFLKHYVPGFENGFVTSIGHYLGVRDGRHPKGEYVFTLDDALTSRRFPDAVTKPMKKSFHWDAGKVHEFEVPYRCFLPQKVENLLLTGASLSFTYDTLFMVMRNFPWCVQTGEIAGFAAAKSVAQGIPPKQYKWTAPLL